MERLQRDLKYFELQMEGEEDRERKILIITQMNEINAKINEILRKERDQLQKEINRRKELNKRGTDPNANKSK